jgi:hypothetical protein
MNRRSVLHSPPRFPDPRPKRPKRDGSPYREAPATAAPGALAPAQRLVRRPELASPAPLRPDRDVRREIALADFEEPREDERRKRRFGGGGFFGAGVFGHSGIRVSFRLLALGAIVVRVLLSLLRLHAHAP